MPGPDSSDTIQLPLSCTVVWSAEAAARWATASSIQTNSSVGWFLYKAFTFRWRKTIHDLSDKSGVNLYSILGGWSVISVPHFAITGHTNVHLYSLNRFSLSSLLCISQCVNVNRNTVVHFQTDETTPHSLSHLTFCRASICCVTQR